MGTAAAPIDPRLGALHDRWSYPYACPAAGKPGIDAASTPDCPTTDQRGVSRPQGSGCDIGSYERGEDQGRHDYLEPLFAMMSETR